MFVMYYVENYTDFKKYCVLKILHSIELILFRNSE